MLVPLRARRPDSPVRHFLLRLGAAMRGRFGAANAPRQRPTRVELATHDAVDNEWLTSEVAALRQRVVSHSRELTRRNEQLEWAHLSVARLNADLAMAEGRGAAVEADMSELRRAIEAAEDALAMRSAETARMAAQVEAAGDAIRRLDAEAIGLLERLRIERYEFAEEAARRANLEVGLAWSRRQIVELTSDSWRGERGNSDRGNGDRSSRGTRATLRGFVLAMRMAARAPGAISRTIELIAASPRRLRTLETIAGSRLFDEKFYLARNPDVAASGMPALIHYVLTGGAEGRDPHPLFSTAFYVTQARGLTESRDRNPLFHYLTHGWRAGCTPHPHFDPIHYVAQYEDVADVSGDPLTHYLEHGSAAGKNPHPSFDVEFYLREHPDVLDAGVEPLTHFVLHGFHEERRPRPAPRAVSRPHRERPSIASSGTSSGTSRLELVARSLAPRHDSRPTILVVSHVGPWRPRAGNEYRVQRMLRWYAHQGYRVIPLIAPLPGEELPREGIDEVAAEFGHVIQVHRNGRIDYVLRDLPDALATLDGAFTASYADLLGEAAQDVDPRTRELLNLERTFCHDAVIATVLHLQRSLGPHILQVEYIWMTRLLPLVRGQALKVVDTHDVFSTIAQKVRLFGIRDAVVEPHEEAARLCRADLAIAIQDDERAELRRLAPTLPIVTAGVDFDVIGGTRGDTRTPIEGRILYVASDNARNRKGLEDFVRLAWPRIYQRVPHAELFVAGSVSRAMTGREVPGVRVLGLVDDLTARYQEASLVINPVVAGTGLKIKMLEALCHLRPIVTWPAGVDGLDPALSALCYVASDWYAFSEQVMRALTRPHAGFTAAERAVIARLVSPEHVYASLDAAFRAYVEPSPSPSRPAAAVAGAATAASAATAAAAHAAHGRPSAAGRTTAAATTATTATAAASRRVTVNAGD